MRVESGELEPVGMTSAGIGAGWLLGDVAGRIPWADSAAGGREWTTAGRGPPQIQIHGGLGANP